MCKVTRDLVFLASLYTAFIIVFMLVAGWQPVTTAGQAVFVQPLRWSDVALLAFPWLLVVGKVWLDYRKN